MSYILINKMTTKPDKREEVIAILLKSGKVFNDNESCELYLVSKDSKNKTVIWIQDIWKDAESHQKAMNSDEMRKYIKQSLPLLTGMPEQIELEAIGGKYSFDFDQ